MAAATGARPPLSGGSEGVAGRQGSSRRFRLRDCPSVGTWQGRHGAATLALGLLGLGRIAGTGQGRHGAATPVCIKAYGMVE